MGKLPEVGEEQPHIWKDGPLGGNAGGTSETRCAGVGGWGVEKQLLECAERNGMPILPKRVVSSLVSCGRTGRNLVHPSRPPGQDAGEGLGKVAGRENGSKSSHKHSAGCPVRPRGGDGSPHECYLRFSGTTDGAETQRCSTNEDSWKGRPAPPQPSCEISPDGGE